MPEPATPRSPRAPTDVVDDYYRAWTTADRDLWASLWHPDGVFLDPPGDPNLRFVGLDAVLRRFDDVQLFEADMSYDRHDTWVCGPEIAVHVTCTCTKGDAGMTFELVHVFEVTDDGRLASVRSFFDDGHQGVFGAGA